MTRCVVAGGGLGVELEFHSDGSNQQERQHGRLTEQTAHQPVVPHVSRGLATGVGTACLTSRGVHATLQSWCKPRRMAPEPRSQWSLSRLVFGGVVLLALGAWAQSLVTFQPNTPARADDVNNNFQAVRTPSGAIIAYAGAGTPAGWLECNGAVISGTTYPELFTVLGSTYGAPGKLPDLRGRVMVSLDTASAVLTGGVANALGKVGGAQFLADVPAHSHGIATDPGHQHGIPGACNNGTSCGNSSDGYVRAPANGGFLPSGGAGAHNHGGATAATGAAQVSDLPPFLTVRYLIKI